MGVLDFIRRKKKDDEFAFNSSAETSAEPLSQPFPEENLRPRFPPQEDLQPISFPSNNPSSTETQLVLAKLDIITQKLENLDKRLQEIEKIAKESQ